jgi:hypothetical protein
VTSTRLPMHGRNHRPKGWYGTDDPGGSDPMNWLNRILGPGPLDQIILAGAPAAFWKLNESAGTTAFDSSGNGYHLSPDTTYHPPDWGQLPGPPGDPSAGFGLHSGRPRAVSGGGPGPPTSAGFTAEIWVRSSETVEHQFALGQWAPFTGAWFIGLGEAFSPTPIRPHLSFIGGGFLLADNVYTADTWVHIAAVRDTGGTWRLYVNGLLQSGTLVPTATTGNPNIAIGSDQWTNVPSPTGSDQYLRGDASYAAIFHRELSGAEIYSHVEAGITAGKTVVAPYEIQPTTDRILFVVGTGDVTLPTAVGRVGTKFEVKNVGVGTVTVTAPGTEQIDAAGSPGAVVLSTAQSAVTVASDGIGWRILGKYL